MNTNHYYEIGSSHLVCQDYAISGKLSDNISYAIISDGCSSSPDVDIGARLLPYAMLKEMTIFQQHTELLKRDTGDLFKRVITDARSISDQLRVTPLCLDCTVLMALSDGKSIHIYVYGDGGIILVDREGKVDYIDFDYDSGAPYYMSYFMEPARHAGYQQEFNSKSCLNIHNYNDQESGLLGTYTKFDENIYKNCFFNLSADKYKAVAVVSDGVKSYTQGSEGETKEIGRYEMAARFGAYKNFVGKFVERRMNKIKIENTANGIVHYDDISVAGIHLG
jgi:hypothetical protein